MSQLNLLLSTFHFQEHHQIFLPVAPRLAYRAAKSLCPRDMSLVIPILLELRSIPDRFSHMPRPRMSVDKPFLDQLGAGGFLFLHDSPAEVVFGLIGQFWKPRPVKVELSSPEDYLSFDKPGYGKIAANLSFNASEGGCLVETETRVFTPDRKARLYFSVYWFFIRLGSGLIRRLWLRAIRRKAIQLASEASALGSTAQEA